MFKRLRLGEEKGFTLIEAQIVVVIMGILFTAAAPKALEARDAAARTAAASNVRTALPAVEMFSLDNAGGWTGMDRWKLATYGSGIAIDVDPAQTSYSSYCIYSSVAGFTYYKLGPSGQILEDSTPTTSPCAF
jgi:prepilin-type N-terminal cleavage/methylation domain-containing protein